MDFNDFDGPRVLAIRGDLTHALCGEKCGQMVLDDVHGDFPTADVGMERAPASLVMALAGTLACGGCGGTVPQE